MGQKNLLAREKVIARIKKLPKKFSIDDFMDEVTLTNHPLSGKPVPESNRNDIRELMQGRYRIISRVKSEDRIDVLTVHHSARLLITEKWDEMVDDE